MGVFSGIVSWGYMRSNKVYIAHAMMKCPIFSLPTDLMRLTYIVKHIIKYFCITGTQLEFFKEEWNNTSVYSSGPSLYIEFSSDSSHNGDVLELSFYGIGESYLHPTNGWLILGPILIVAIILLVVGIVCCRKRCR